MESIIFDNKKQRLIRYKDCRFRQLKLLGSLLLETK